MRNFLNSGISTTIGLMIIIAVAVLATSGILAYQNWWMPKEEANNKQQTINQQTNNVQPTDQTANWKIYTNNQYGFEIKYPADFNLVNRFGPDGNDTAIEIKKDNSALEVSFNPIITGGGCGVADEFTFSTLVYIPTNKFDNHEKNITISDEPFKILYSVLPQGYCNNDIPEKCTKNTRVSAYLKPLSIKFEEECYRFQINGNKYVINFGGEFDTKNTNEALGVFEKILSTIKFAK